MEKNEVEQLVALRSELIVEFGRLKDYKNNKNAIMMEKLHAEIIHGVIVKIDKIIGKYVNFTVWTFLLTKFL